MRLHRHKWKARLHNTKICNTLEDRDADFGYPQTTIIMICIRCGKIQIESHNEKLVYNDFRGTSVGDMIVRYYDELPISDTFEFGDGI